MLLTDQIICWWLLTLLRLIFLHKYHKKSNAVNQSDYWLDTPASLWHPEQESWFASVNFCPYRRYIIITVDYLLVDFKLQVLFSDTLRK